MSIQSLPKPSCATCHRWEHKKRGRTCRHDRKVKIDGEKVKGTPPDYWCKEYTPLVHALCEECVYWKDKRMPRKKGPCSTLGLLDLKGEERTGKSTYCKKFQQKGSITPYNNKMLRIDGSLAAVFDIDQHSKELPIVIRSSETSAVLLKWDPHGPGEGQWVVMPLELDTKEDLLYATQHNPGSIREQTDMLFSGSVTLNTQKGTKTLYGQAFNKVKNKVSSLILRVRARRKRGISKTVSKDPVDIPAAKRIQDEPWGPDWEDLKEQMENLLDTGLGPSSAAARVREEWEKDTNRKLGDSTAARLEAQLKVSFR